MSGFTDKVREKLDAVSAAIDNELTVLEGAGGDDVLDRDADDQTPAPDTPAPDTAEPQP